MAISVSFPFSWAAQPGAWRPNLSGTSSSIQHLISNSFDPQLQLLNVGPEGPLCWVLAFSSAPCLQLSDLQNWLNFKWTQLYNSPTPTQSLMHFHRVWNDMFDRHRAEITVMQFTGHSLPVHQFVTVPGDFNPVPNCQPSSPSPTEYALPPSLEWHVWPGRRSIYYS